MKVPPSMMYVLTLREKSEKWFQIEQPLIFILHIIIVTNKLLHIYTTYILSFQMPFSWKYFPLQKD